MTKLYDGRKRTGYSSEEAYFHEENKKLIAELRKKNGRPAEQPVGGEVIDATEQFAARRASAQAGKSGQEKQKKAA